MVHWFHKKRVGEANGKEGGRMERAAGYFKKTPEITNSLMTLIDNENFRNLLGKAGSIGALFSIGIDVYSKVKNDLKTADERAYASLIQIAFESAKESISTDSNGILVKSDVTNENTKRELFETFIKTEEEEWNSYLPDHPVIKRFRGIICKLLRYSQYDLSVGDFVFNFNTTLEEKADKNQNIEPFRKRILHIDRKKNLIKHLEYSRSLIYKPNPVDKRYLEEYYVENNATIIPADHWDATDDYFLEDLKHKGFRAGKLIVDYVRGKRYLIVAAPFGMGKTSLSIYITSTLASKYLEDINNGELDESFIPVFVPLKGKLRIIDETENSLDDVLRSIAPGEEGKKRKILLICDGLDEYGDDVNALIKFLDDNLRSEYPNMKFIITTRPEAGFPEKLQIQSYIRLFPFNEDQVNEFFQKYGMSDLSFKKLRHFDFKEEEIRRPLFCWMFTIFTQSESYDEVILKESTSSSMTKALIYGWFIHSIIRGKYRHTADQYHYSKYHFEEKKILRKIAALRQMYEPNILTKNMVIDGLRNYFGLLDYDDKKLQNDIINPILTSYFYLKDTTSPFDKSIDFMHKSFREYLLAEYYIESIFYDKKYYLNVGIPSSETMSYLEGLLELIVSQNEKVEEQVNDLLKSLLSPKTPEIWLLHKFSVKSSIISSLSKRAQRYYEDEQIVLPPDRTAVSYQDRAWNLIDLTNSRYPQIFVHRWLGLYVLNKLSPEVTLDKKTLADFIVKTSHIIPSSLKRLAKADLSGENEFLEGEQSVEIPGTSDINLSGANLSGANLSGANLSGANLSGANLDYADLSNANLTFSNLSKTSLRSNLSMSDLSGANLEGAELFGANLAGANLSNANLSGTKLSNAILSGTILSNVF
jgi:hypothetical protein